MNFKQQPPFIGSHTGLSVDILALLWEKDLQ
jgi:hypothetical protein